MHNRVRMVVGSFLTKNLGIHWRLGEEWFWDTLVNAAPFFRIFNPETQAKRFDPDGNYVRRWAPALSAPPIMDLKESRQAALDAYAEIKDEAGNKSRRQRSTMGLMMSPRIHSQAQPPIGHTPLMRVEAINPRTDVHLYLKLEQFNLGGSAKDRTARALIQAALGAGDIGPGSTLVESSSGNLGMALARQAPLAGMKFHCVVDPRVNSSTVATMRAYGAHVELLDHPDPETGDWLTARRTRVAELLEEIPDSFNLNQYSNEAAFYAHAEGTMTEIVDQLGQAPTHLLVAMSTTGTLGGCVRKLTELGADTETIGVDAEGSVLFGGQRGTRMLPGYGAGIVTDLSTKFSPSSVERVPDLDAIVAARRLAQAEGLLPGASGGAVIAAFQRLVPTLPAGAEVVAVLHDGGQPYLDTIYSDSWVYEHFDISPAELAARVEGDSE